MSFRIFSGIQTFDFLQLKKLIIYTRHHLVELELDISIKSITDNTFLCKQKKIDWTHTNRITNNSFVFPREQHCF